MADLVQAFMKRTKRPETAQAVLDSLRSTPRELPPAVLWVPRPEGAAAGQKPVNNPQVDWALDLVLPYLVAYAAVGRLSTVSLSLLRRSTVTIFLSISVLALVDTVRTIQKKK